MKRILSRNHPEVDEGWLCDKGRFAYSHLHARDRITGAAARRPARAGSSRSSWEDALDEAERLLRAAGAAIVTALSGGETVEQAYALARLLRVGPRRTRSRAAGGGTRRARRAAARRSRRFATRRRSRSSCDEPVVERAPVVDLWLEVGPPQGRDDHVRRSRTAPSTRSSPTTRSRATGCEARNVYYLPRTPNGRGVADAWSAAGDGEPVDEKPRLLVISGDEAATDPNVRALAADAEHVLGDRHVRGQLPRRRRPRPARDELPRARRHDGEPRRPAAAAAPRGDGAGAGRARVDREARRALRASRSRRTRRCVFEEMSARCFGGIAFADVGEHAALPPRAEPRTPNRFATNRRVRRAPACGSSRTARSSPAPPSSARRSSQFQRPPPRSQLSRDDATSARDRERPDRQRVARTARPSSCARASRTTSRPAPCASPREHAGDLHATWR